MPERIRPPDEYAGPLELKPDDTPHAKVAHTAAPDAVALRAEILRILVAVGMPDWRAAQFHTTPSTRISDFRDSGRHPGAYAHDLAVKLGVPVGEGDMVLEIARRLRARP